MKEVGENFENKEENSDRKKNELFKGEKRNEGNGSLVVVLCRYIALNTRNDIRQHRKNCRLQSLLTTFLLQVSA